MTGNHEIFYSFANRHPYIQKFVSIIDSYEEEEEIVRMVLRILRALPLVREFGLGCKNFTHSCAIKIVNQCEKLERYRFWRDTIGRYHLPIGPKARYHPPHVEWWFYTQ